MKQTFVSADSPVDVGALLANLSTGNQPVEEVFLGCSGGAVTFNLPAIADLPQGSFNQKIVIVLIDAAADATLQPDADDRLCILGTGIALNSTTGVGGSYILQPVWDNIWHVDRNDAAAF